MSRRLKLVVGLAFTWAILATLMLWRQEQRLDWTETQLRGMIRVEQERFVSNRERLGKLETEYTQLSGWLEDVAHKLEHH